MPSRLQVKRLFFDRKAVIEAVGRVGAAVLSKGGAFIRQRAKSSMRKRKKVAAAGKPPSAHEGGIKRLLFFSYDLVTRSLVVGPEKYRSGEAPRLAEFGGDVVRNGKTLHYQKHPFMKPALDAELSAGTLPKAWANSIKR